MTDAKPQKKEISLLGVFSVATGTTLSAGFFLLPSLAARDAGSGMILAYVIAALMMLPAMFSIIELSTAMPRAGGVYFFLDRTLGPMAGTIGGIGTWLTLVLKVAFAMIGMGAYLHFFLPKSMTATEGLFGTDTVFAGQLPIVPIAVGFTIILGGLNLLGAKKSGGFQIVLVVALVSILAVFVMSGLMEILGIISVGEVANHGERFAGMWSTDGDELFATAGMVFISYAGVTKATSLAGEVSNPERNIPLGLFLSMGVATLIYTLGTIVMVGVMPLDALQETLTPVAAAARTLFSGSYATIAVTVMAFAAMMAFVSAANAGIMSASRFPMAMSRDHMLPKFFRALTAQGTPANSIIITVLSIIAVVVFLDPMKIAKLASAFQLLLFALVALGVIVMRESRIDSYDPGYKSPLYPWMQIVGIIAPLWMIAGMGMGPILFTLVLVVVGIAWYRYYASDKVARNGAIYHLFERWGRLRYAGLDRELRGILKEKGLRAKDPFDAIVMQSHVIDLPDEADFDAVVPQAAEYLTRFLPYTAERIGAEFLEGTRIGATPVTHGMALPHFRAEGIEQAFMVLVRARKGVRICLRHIVDDKEDEREVQAIFFLVSPDSDPAQHLRILARIAGRLDEDSFDKEWKEAEDEQGMKEALLHEDSFFSLTIHDGDATASLLAHPLSDIAMPDECLVALVRRGGSTFIPNGSTVLRIGDQLTVIGKPSGLGELRERYGQS